MRINRTQALVLGCVLFAWVSLVGILVAAPDVFAGALKLPAGIPEHHWLALLAAITGAVRLSLGAALVRAASLFRGKAAGALVKGMRHNTNRCTNNLWRTHLVQRPRPSPASAP